MNPTKRILSMVLAIVMVIGLLPANVFAAEADATLTASLEEAKSYIDGITINNSSNDPATVVKNFKTHFTWDNEKRENSKSYLFDWSYYNGVVFEGIEYVYEVTGESVYKDYVVEYMSSLITSSGTWATCTNNSSKQCAGYNSTHGADCYKTASLLLDAYEMTGDSRYLTMAATLYADLDSAANSYSLKNAGNNYRHTWASDPSPDLWLDGLYMILPFRAEYAKYIGDTEELDLIVDRMQWVSDNMYNSSKGLFYHAADSASSNSGTYWLRSIGWYAAAIVDIMDSMEGDNLEAMKVQLKKLVDGMKACQNSSNGMWLNNMNASQSSSNPYETSGTALVCYAVMKAVNNGWLDESYADMAILAFNGICSEKLSGSTLTDICFKGAPGSSNSTFYDNEGKGVGPFIMFYAEMLEYVNKAEEEPEVTEPEVTEPEVTEPEVTEPEVTEPEVTEPEETEPEEELPVYSGTGNLVGDVVYTLDSDGINSGEKYLIVYSGKALQNNNGVDKNPAVTVSNNTITLSDDSTLGWTITLSSGNNYYVENNGSYLNLSSSGNDPIGSSATVYITRSSSKYTFRKASGSGAYLRYSNSQLWCAGTSSSNNGMYLYRRTSTGTGDQVVFTLTPSENAVKPGSTLVLNGTVTVGGQSVDLSSCTITWSSSDNSCATVSGGIVTGVASGNATITATLSAVNGSDLKSSIVLSVPVVVQGHEYTYVVTAPTCTEQGYTTYTCTICGDSYVTDYTAALGHTHESVTVEPGCTENGSITYTCHCGDTYTEVIEAIGHDYKAVVTAPTCNDAGYTTYTCGNCGDSYIADEVAALGHTYESVTVEATCTEDGSITYTCHCGDSYVVVIEAIGHDYKAVVTAPTCTEKGYTTYTCGNCGDSYIADEVAALGHTYESVTVEATCTENGSITYTCHCGDSYVEVIEAIGHEYEAVVTAPTCVNGGYTTYTCGTCGDSYVADLVDALGHDVESVVTAPTCEAEGYTTHTCNVCGEVTVDSYVDALGHTYESVTVEATCTEDGSITYTCHCGDTYTEVIEATGHDYKAVVTAPTCTEAGYTTYTCHCGDSYIADEVAALGHTYESVTVEATCTEDGSITYTCNCGDSYVEVIEAIGHDYKAAVTDPTCTEAGFTTYTCGNCGDSYTADHVDALGHDYEIVTVDPTCTENGSVTTTCTVCGDSTVEMIEALGHDYNAVVIAPTCTENGYTIHTCHCGDSYTAEIVDALGHDMKSVVTAPTCEDQGYTTNTCSVCGEVTVDSYVDALGHTYESVTVEATCIENGYITYTCHCGDSYVEVIEAIGHDYKAVVTAPTCTEGGYTTYTCHCGDSHVADHVDALGHNYESVTVEATCTEDGSITYTCHCGDTYTEVIEAIGHTYEAVVTAPTCQSEGYTTYNCHCGESYVDNYTAAIDHVYKSVTVQPTCTEDGSVTYTCQCGDSYVEIVAASGHDYEAVITAPTCTETGYTTYTCHCGDSYVADEVAALGHIYNSVTVDPTCTEGGYTTHTCQVCEDSYVDALTDALGHEYEAVTTAPTCTEIGYTTYTCHCGESYVADEVAALGHSYESVTVEATCTENGSITYTCHCGDSYVEVIEAIGHDYQTVVTAPTCTEAGYTTYTCGTCGDTYVADEVAALGHNYTSVTVDATCTEDGSITYTCHCGDSYVEVIEAIGHDYQAVVTDPTCTEVGYTTYTCGTCGETYVADEVAALGHSYESVTVEATCTQDGSITYTCHCGDSYVEVIEATGHNYQAVVTAPTCTEAGYTNYTCASCDSSYVADQIDALGHVIQSVVTDPTCETEGYTTHTCTVCGEITVDTYTEALGHSYESVTVEATCTENGSITYTCHCGDSYVEVIEATGHDYEEVVTAPTCTDKGYTTHTCTVCGDSYTDSNTHALGHSYNCEEENGYLIYTCESCGDSYTESVAWIALGSRYVLDTDGIDVGEEHKYIVVGADKNYALTLSGTTVGAASVTIEDNAIVLEDGSKYEFYFKANSAESNTYLLTQDGSKGIYHVGGNIQYGHDSKGYWYFGSSSGGSYQLYDFDNLNWFLNYGYVWGSDSVSRFAVSSNARYIRLFKATESFARLSGEVFQTYTHDAGVDADAILSKLVIQLNEDGANVSETLAVTSDMISWDKSFEGFTAGTYTGTITYQGVVLGSVTVSITGEHTYESVVTEATCTTAGGTVHTCTACGHSYSENVSEALGHSYSCVESDGYYVYTCDRCGDSYSEKSISYTQVSAISAGNDYVITLYSNRKYYALSHGNNSISVVEISVSNGEITSEITDDLLWTYSNNKMSYVSNGTTYYMYCYTNNWWGGWWGSWGTSLQLSSSNSSIVTFSNKTLKVGSYYLRYSNGSVNLNSSGTTTYVFIED